MKVIGIEGLVGAGKTSICRNLLKRIENSVLINGGDIYRGIVYVMMKNGNTIEKMKQEGKKLNIREMIDLFNIEVKVENNETFVYSNGEKISEENLQCKETSLAVSEVSKTADNKDAFIYVHNLIEKLKEDYNVIFSGRSTMKIYPCDYHFFVVADLEERVKRKFAQYENKVSIEEVRDNIIKRDLLQEQSGFYEYSPITVEIDVTDCKNVDESTDLLLEQMKEYCM